jgi:hypothetical protein
VVPGLMEGIGASVGFTMEELASNRAGKLSPHQVTENIKDALGFGGLILVLFGMAIVSTFSGKLGLVRIILSIFIWGLALASFALGGREIAGSLSGKVRMAEGALGLTTSPNGRERTLRVGSYQTVLDPTSTAHKILVPGESYRVFYLAGSQKLLSLEPQSQPSSPGSPENTGNK